MEIPHLNMYQRLRDFLVPAAVLDEIFDNNEDLDKLTDAWNALKSDGFTDDETAEEISKIFLKELDIEPEK